MILIELQDCDEAAFEVEGTPLDNPTWAYDLDSLSSHLMLLAPRDLDTKSSVMPSVPKIGLDAFPSSTYWGPIDHKHLTIG